MAEPHPRFCSQHQKDGNSESWELAVRVHPVSTAQGLGSPNSQLPAWYSIPASPNSAAKLLTHAMQEELALGGEAVVNDVVQQGDVQAPGGQVSHD